MEAYYIGGNFEDFSTILQLRTTTSTTFQYYIFLTAAAAQV